MFNSLHLVLIMNLRDLLTYEISHEQAKPNLFRTKNICCAFHIYKITTRERKI